MDNSLQVFQSEQFGSVRTLDEDGKVYFCGADISGPKMRLQHTVRGR